MRQYGLLRRLGLRAGAGLVAAFLVTAAPIVPGTIAPAQAQAVVAEFHEALAPYGRWETVSRWGEVWIPTQVDRDWRPYTVGHWVYTDDWGWYWAADTAEEDWGWITYHYGRWLHSRDVGWFWIPGDEWSPAWVHWRRGAEYVGWAPLPPDDVVVEYRDAPEFWCFVRPRDFLSERIVNVIVPFREQERIIRNTVVVNRTIVLNERHFAVNPGIEPAIVAAAVGRPVRTFSVQPHVLAGTARIEGAREIRAEELRGRRGEVRTTFRETNTTIRPTTRVPPPQPLAAGERGRLGEHAPRAAQATGREQPGAGQQLPGEQRRGEQQRSPTQGRALTPEEQRRQGQQQKQQQQQQQQQGQGAQPSPSTQGRAATPEQQRRGEQRRPGTEGRAVTPEQQQRQQQRAQPGTQGRGTTTEEQRRLQQRPGTQAPQGKQAPQGTQGRGGATQQEDRRGQQPGRAAQQPPVTRGEQRSPATEGRSRGPEPKSLEPKAAPSRSGLEQRPANQGRTESRPQTRPEPRTEGRGGGAQPQQAAPQRAMPPAGTEGRGGGAPRPGPAAAPRGNERGKRE